jgi:coproporphyrinogen III oxidase
MADSPIDPPQTKAVLSYFKGLQKQLLERLQEMDTAALLTMDPWQRSAGGGGISAVLSGGELVEKGGVNFSHVYGQGMPASATKARPALSGQPFEAAGVSVVLHPRNPFVPCCHMNVRFLRTTPTDPQQPAAWWFGGGFDLTPVYPFTEDAVAWHRAAAEACAPFGADLYKRCKSACDRYFHLPHREETRGVGGLFFDDYTGESFADGFAFTRAVGDAFLPAWSSIAERRRNTEFDDRHKQFQLYRRGRYVEFNLLYDRGTLFGIQSGGRTESVLMSLPPMAAWTYGYQAEPGSPEAVLVSDFLKPRDWLAPGAPFVSQP